MPKILLSKDEIIQVLLAVFRQKGYDGTSLVDLSKSTGLSKASLYHHFKDGKEEMALAVIQKVGEVLTENIIDKLYAKDAPNKKITEMFKTTCDFYAAGDENCLLGVFNTCEALSLFRPYLASAAEAWMAAIAHVLVEKGYSKSKAAKMSVDFMVRLEGSLVLARIMKNTEIFTDTLDELKKNLLAS